MTEGFSVMVKQGGTYKHYSNCTVDGVFAKCNECEFCILAVGHFSDEEIKQIKNHNHNMSISYSMRAEKISDGG